MCLQRMHWTSSCSRNWQSDETVSSLEMRPHSDTDRRGEISFIASKLVRNHRRWDEAWGRRPKSSLPTWQDGPRWNHLSENRFWGCGNAPDGTLPCFNGPLLTSLNRVHAAPAVVPGQQRATGAFRP